MPVDDRPRPLLTRRRLLAASVAGGGLVVAGCGSDGESEDESTTDTGGDRRGSTAGDISLLNIGLDLELMAVAAYETGREVLTGTAKSLAELLLEHEQEHAERLRRDIRDLGGTPRVPKAAYDIPTGMATATQVFQFTLAVERTTIAAYLDAIGELSEPELRGTVSAIVTSEAQHVAVLLGELDREQVPDAFLMGAL